MRILGYTRYSFTGENGKPCSGATFYCGYPINRNYGYGSKPAKPFSLSDEKISELIPLEDLNEFVGCDVILYFNQWGRVAKMDILDLM